MSGTSIRRGRRLSSEEQALWNRVVASVRPLGAKAPPALEPEPAAPPAPSPKPSAPAPRPAKRQPAPPSRAATLDAGWDKRLARGLVQPDCTIDLHGHSLASAYALLDDALERAVARGDRVLLLVTGKPPAPLSERPHARGAIRAAVGDWLAASRHAERIAAVRQANVRHGGLGALYIVLRRSRAGPKRKS